MFFNTYIFGFFFFRIHRFKVTHNRGVLMPPYSPYAILHQSILHHGHWTPSSLAWDNFQDHYMGAVNHLRSDRNLLNKS